MRLGVASYDRRAPSPYGTLLDEAGLKVCRETTGWTGVLLGLRGPPVL